MERRAVESAVESVTFAEVEQLLGRDCAEALANIKWLHKRWGKVIDETRESAFSQPEKVPVARLRDKSYVFARKSCGLEKVVKVLEAMASMESSMHASCSKSMPALEKWHGSQAAKLDNVLREVQTLLLVAGKEHSSDAKDAQVQTAASTAGQEKLESCRRAIHELNEQMKQGSAEMLHEQKQSFFEMKTSFQEAREILQPRT